MDWLELGKSTIILILLFLYIVRAGDIAILREDLAHSRWLEARERQRANTNRTLITNYLAAHDAWAAQMSLLERRYAHFAIRRRRWQHHSAYRRLGSWQVIRRVL